MALLGLHCPPFWQGCGEHGSDTVVTTVVATVTAVVDVVVVVAAVVVADVELVLVTARQF